MSLLGDLQNADKFEHTRGPRCQVCNLLTTLGDEEASALRDVIAAGAVSFAALSRLLAANGHRVAAGTIARHKSGVCNGAA